MNFKLNHIGICDKASSYSAVASPSTASYTYIVKQNTGVLVD